jgi:hypothetical protein
MFQGKALFTLHNKEKDTHITFRVQTPKRKRGQPEETRFFEVHVKALNDKYAGNRYIGRIDRKSRSFKANGYVERDHVGVKTVDWLIRNWNNLEEWEQHDKLSIYHLGVCCKCGLPLTVPESIQNGIGPKCMQYREGKSIELLKEVGLYQKGVEYADLVYQALEVRQDLFDKIFVPDHVRRASKWYKLMDRVSNDIGLF